METKHTPRGVPGAWYDQSPADYARGLLYGADRSDETARHKRDEGKPWSYIDAEHFERQARRLRAMARLCTRSNATRAGDVDFLGLTNPAQSREAEAAAIAKAEGK